MTDRNRDFSQVRVGTVVGFLNPALFTKLRARGPYVVVPIFSGIALRNDKGIAIALEESFFREHGGYIISQPDDAQEQPSEVVTRELLNTREFVEYIFDDGMKAVSIWRKFPGNSTTQAWAAAVESKVRQWQGDYRCTCEQPSAGRTDAEMLDWLIQRTFYGVPGFDPIVPGRTPEQRIADCRAAISAAMDGEAGE